MGSEKISFKIIRIVEKNTIEFISNKNIEPNLSFEIESCIKEIIKPTDFVYRPDFWFDDNDSGYFLKDNIKVEFHYGVMTDFIFTVNNTYSENELLKIENWLTSIFNCLFLKEQNYLNKKNK